MAGSVSEKARESGKRAGGCEKRREKVRTDEKRGEKGRKNGKRREKSGKR